MNMAYLMIPVALLAVSLLISFILVKKGKPAKKVMRVHFLTLILIVAATCAVPFMGLRRRERSRRRRRSCHRCHQRGRRHEIPGGRPGCGPGRHRRRYAVASGAPAAIGATAEDPKAFG